MSIDTLLLSDAEQSTLEWLCDRSKTEGPDIDFGKVLYRLKSSGATSYQRSAQLFIEKGLLELDYTAWRRAGVVDAGNETSWPNVCGCDASEVTRKVAFLETFPWPDCRITSLALELRRKQAHGAHGNALFPKDLPDDTDARDLVLELQSKRTRENTDTGIATDFFGGDSEKARKKLKVIRAWRQRGVTTLPARANDIQQSAPFAK